MTRTLTQVFLVVGLALSVSHSAGAVISIGLVQVGGTYDGVHANPGDTLVLNITYSLQSGDFLTLLDPGIVWDGAVASFDAASSTRTPDSTWGPIILGAIIQPEPVPHLVEPNRASGWGKGTTVAGGITPPCVYGACTSLGTAVFVLSGSSGSVWVGAIALPEGTVVGDGTFMDIAGNPALVSLGTFTIVPEPAAASLLGLGLVGLAAAARLRRR